AISYVGGAVQLRDAKSWKAVEVLGCPDRESDQAWGICFSRDSKHLALGCLTDHPQDDGLVKYHDLVTHEYRILGKVPHIATQVAISQRGVISLPLTSPAPSWSGTLRRGRSTGRSGRTSTRSRTASASRAWASAPTAGRSSPRAPTRWSGSGT